MKPAVPTHVALLVLLAGCRVGYEPTGNVELDGAIDGATQGRALGPFGMPQHIDTIAAGDGGDDDDDPTLTADMRELVFNSERAGGPGNGDIWVSRRNSTSDPWGAPELVVELSSGSAESTPELRGDGLQIWFASDRTGSLNGSLDIWTATRAARTDPWSNITRVAELASTEDDIDPTIFPDGLHFVFSSNRPGGTADFDPHLASRATTGALWTIDRRIDELVTAEVDGECFPVDARTFAFRTGAEANLFVATRPSDDGTFDDVEELTELNSDSGDGDAWVSPDRQTIYFASSRDGDLDIYFAVAE